MCDSLCALPAASATEVTVFAKNSDRPPTEPQDLEWHPPRLDEGGTRTTYIEIDPFPGPTYGVLGSRPRWMWGMEHGVNDAGLAVGNEAVWTTLDPHGAEPALVGMDLVRLALERAGDAEGGVAVITDLLLRHGQGGGGHEGGERPYWSSFLLADPSRAFVVETSGTRYAVEEVRSARAISNRTTIPHFDAEHGLRSVLVERLVDPRLAASEAVLARPATVDRMKAHLRSHDGGDDGWTVCMHADEATTAGMVVELAPDAPRVAHVVLGQPCTSIFVPVVVGRPLGEVPAWERFAALDASARGELRALEERLAAEVRADDAWNAEAFGRVGALLVELEARRT